MSAITTPDGVLQAHGDIVSFLNYSIVSDTTVRSQERDRNAPRGAIERVREEKASERTLQSEKGGSKVGSSALSGLERKKYVALIGNIRDCFRFRARKRHRKRCVSSNQLLTVFLFLSK